MNKHTLHPDEPNDPPLSVHEITSLSGLLAGIAREDISALHTQSLENRLLLATLPTITDTRGLNSLLNADAALTRAEASPNLEAHLAGIAISSESTTSVHRHQPSQRDSSTPHRRTRRFAMPIGLLGLALAATLAFWHAAPSTPTDTMSLALQSTPLNQKLTAQVDADLELLYASIEDRSAETADARSDTSSGTSSDSLVEWLATGSSS